MDRQIKGMFLGPQAENAQEFESFMLEVLRDHVFWRRNYHPNDPRLIMEQEKYTPEFSEMISQMKDNLFRTLANIKSGAPLYSPRQIGHIVTDPTLPALAGYFAGMLYNQNNVVEEASPETLQKEAEYMKAVAEMVGYPEFVPSRISEDSKDSDFSWGHLCSGGTIANLEALWITRNLKFYPLALKLLCKTEQEFDFLADLEVTQPSGNKKRLCEIDTFHLFNIKKSEVIALRDKARAEVTNRGLFREYKKVIPSIKKLGLPEFLFEYNNAFPDDQCRPPKILISQAQHYCWKKNADICGLGSNSLIEIPVNEKIRLDLEQLKKTLNELIDEKTPVLSIVSICGTTEESSIDPTHRINELKRELEKRDISFWHHSDAALGGFFASMLPKNNGGFVEYDDLKPKDKFIAKEVYNGIKGLANSDSMAIDPHKFGYQPYPCGAVLFKNYRSRDFISYEAPYLATPENAGFGGFIGQWTLEGSRPGATAMSCYLSQSVLNLNSDGHGKLIRHCIESTKNIVNAIEERFAGEDTELDIVPLTSPDTAGYCFVIIPAAGISGIDKLNEYTKHIWTKLSVGREESHSKHDFLISKTEVGIDKYRELLQNIFKKKGKDLPAENNAASMILLRLFVMNPFISAWDEFPKLFSERFYNAALDSYNELFKK